MKDNQLSLLYAAMIPAVVIILALFAGWLYFIFGQPDKALICGRVLTVASVATLALFGLAGRVR